MGSAHSGNHRRGGQRHFQAGERRGADRLLVTQLATKVVVSRNIFTRNKAPERGDFIRQLIHRVARTIADWGVKDGYFTKKDGEIFYDELSWLCLNQHGAFNSPVWFNVGLHHEYGAGSTSAKGNWHYKQALGQAERATLQYENFPQGGACFIQSVNDDMESILQLAHSEGMLLSSAPAPAPISRPSARNARAVSGGGTPAARWRSSASTTGWLTS